MSLMCESMDVECTHKEDYVVGMLSSRDPVVSEGDSMNNSFCLGKKNLDFFHLKLIKAK
jgi:hypothetical protein